jgi:hypothetical protein
MTDARTANVMRQDYRILSEEEKSQVKEIQDLGQEFVDACNRYGKSRELVLAITNVEQATMWAVRFLTGDKQ